MKCKNKKCGVSFLGVEKWYYCCKKCGRSMPRNFPVDLENRSKARKNTEIYRGLINAYTITVWSAVFLSIILRLNVDLINRKYFTDGSLFQVMVAADPFLGPRMTMLVAFNLLAAFKKRMDWIHILADPLPEIYRDMIEVLARILLVVLFIYFSYKFEFVGIRNELLKKYSGNPKHLAGARLHISTAKIAIYAFSILTIAENVIELAQKWFLRKMHSGDRRMGL